MDGIFGWLGDHSAHQNLIKQMGRAARLSPDSPPHEHSSEMLGVAGASRFGKAGVHVENGLAATLYGRPRFLDEELAFIARDKGAVAAVAHGWLRFGEKLPTLMHGNFAFAVLEPQEDRVLAMIAGAEYRLCLS
jgi:asparagine synthase (glutamine-hydrolysing)